MRIFFGFITCVVLCISGFARTSGLGDERPSFSMGNQAHESPFACDRLALEPVARSRHFDQLGPQLRAIKTGVRELSNGYAFQFPADVKTVQLVAEWAAGERLCCPFFDISIRLEPEGGPVWLTITGREGTKRFLQVDVSAWIKP
jgi:hypothetical protein